MIALALILSLMTAPQDARATADAAVEDAAAAAGEAVTAAETADRAAIEAMLAGGEVDPVIVLALADERRAACRAATEVQARVASAAARLDPGDRDLALAWAAADAIRARSCAAPAASVAP